MTRRVSLIMSFALGFGASLTVASGAAQESAATGPDVAARSTYPAGEGPVILVDVTHNNFDPRASRDALLEWLARDGYRIRHTSGPFSRGELEAAQIVIIKNALADRNAEKWTLPTPSAFTWLEIELLRDWVRQGGGLLLVVDHMPMAGAVQELAAAFDIEISNGYAVDEDALHNFDAQTISGAGTVTFRRSDVTLNDHAVTNGQGVSERIDSVFTYGGAALRSEPGGVSLLRLRSSFVSLLPQDAWNLNAQTPRAAVGGWSQGIVRRLGRGRVAVFGDAAIMTTPAMAQSRPVGRRPAQNPQFLLNVLHWLSGTLDGPQ